MIPHEDGPGAGEHGAAQLALPWLLEGSLDARERERVNAHLLACAACREDLAALATISRAPLPALPDCDPGRALARLEARLDETPQEPAPRGIPSPAPAANDSRWLRAVVAAQFAGLAILLGLLARPTPADAPYLALGAGAPAAANLVVQFAPETPEAELRRILQAHGARIVGGPTAAGAYLLDLPEGRIAPALAGMRAEAPVRLVQPLAQEARP